MVGFWGAAKGKACFKGVISAQPWPSARSNSGSPAPSRKVVEDLAPKILAARRMAGLTQKELVERLGYSQTYVSLAERGMTPFRAYMVPRRLRWVDSVPWRAPLGLKIGWRLGSPGRQMI